MQSSLIWKKGAEVFNKIQITRIDPDSYRENFTNASFETFMENRDVDCVERSFLWSGRYR